MDLKKELDKIQAQIFINCNVALLAPLLSSIHVKWDDSLKTCWTNGTTIGLYQEQFLKFPNSGKVLLIHELSHIARLHCLPMRQGNRDHKLWNQACDFRINNDSIAEGLFTEKDLKDLNGLYDPDLDKDGILSEEEIYELLESGAYKIPEGQDGDSVEHHMKGLDMHPLELISKVTYAMNQAKMTGNVPGQISGQIEEIINRFSKPKIPWQVKLKKLFTELRDLDYSWSRPNRRFHDMYLPSLVKQEDGLQSLMYFLDISGSISEEQIRIFLTEVLYIHRVLAPDKLTLVQFDTEIKQVTELTRDKQVSSFNIVGRGGTDLECVAEHIDIHKPSAVVVFSDMCCHAMRPLKKKLPVFWVIFDNATATVPYGTTIHVDSHDYK